MTQRLIYMKLRQIQLEKMKLACGCLPQKVLGDGDIGLNPIVRRLVGWLMAIYKKLCNIILLR